jgi:VWFA-related protein
MVQVTVLVHDKDGNPIMGLGKDDFKIFDEGVPQQIAKFSEQTTHLTTTGDARPSNVLSNRVQQAVVAPRLVIVVLDIRESAYLDYVVCLNPPPRPECGAVARTFQAGQKFLSTLEPQDRVALYEFADNLYLLHDFTSDREELLRALEKGKEYVRNINLTPAGTRAIDIASQVSGAMRAIADHVATLSGRKYVVWLSIGFRSRDILSDPDIQKATRSLNNADAPLYAVDAKALVGSEFWPSYGHDGAGGGNGRGANPGQSNSGRVGGSSTSSGRASDMYEWFHTLGGVALGSGGGIFQNTNDLSGAMHQAVDDSRALYVLGYYPTHEKWNGSYHSIKVEVDRPGVEVRSRNGYYATPDSTQSTPSIDRRIADVVHNPLESTDLGFDVTVDAVNGSSGRELNVKVLVDAGQVHFTKDGDRWTDALEIVWAKTDALGQRTIFKSQTLNMKPTEDHYQKLLQNGLSFMQTVEVPSDAESLRIVLCDVGSTVTGSVDIPLSKAVAQRSQ